MANLKRLTALALARAMLAGPPTAAALTARLHACLGAQPGWCATLAEHCARWPRERWWRLEPRALARVVESDSGYQEAWQGAAPPFVRHYIQQSRRALPPAPLGLDTVLRPDWPHLGALATGLGLTPGGLWRLTRPAAWQSALPLARQHHRFELRLKPAGGWRLLEVPEPHLMAVQRRLLRSLLAQVPVHAAACGFVRGRSVRDHAAAHAGQAMVLQFDLQDFFASVRASRVHALFATLGYGEEVARALTALCTVATPEPVLQRGRQDGGFTWQQGQRLRDPHLAQGAPTSPVLANLCAFGLDLRLQGLADALGARYTRYADDIALSGGAALQTARERIGGWVARIAHDEGFALNHRKTRCRPQGRRQQLCGVVVNQHPNLPRDAFDRLKAQLHDTALHGTAAANCEGHADWLGHLRGRVAWAEQLNPDKARRLRRLLDRIRPDT